MLTTDQASLFLWKMAKASHWEAFRLRVNALSGDLSSALHSVDAEGNTLLMQASSDGNGEIVKLLLKHQVDLHATNHDGRTALHEAASIGWASVLFLLIREGSRMEAHDNEGNTPLHSAAHGGALANVETLLELGANPWAKNHQNEYRSKNMIK